MKKSQRLVLITNGLNGQHGGIQRVSRAVLDAVRGDSIPTVFWSFNDKQGESEPAEHLELSFRCFGGNRLMMAWEALMKRFPQGVRSIFCFHLALSPMAAILAWRLECPFHVFLHGIEAWRPLSWMQQMALHSATTVDANSEYTLKIFRRAHPKFADKPGKVLKLGLSEDFVKAIPASEGFLQQYPHPFFLSVARFAEDYKGESTLFKAFTGVQRRHPEVHLVCVGDGPTCSRLKQKVARLGLMDVVHFPGCVSESELNALYAGCLGFVMLSEGEGFGIVYVEAMFHGKPCLATNADASQEIVQNGVTGFVVPSGNPAAAERALICLLEDSGLARRMGEEGRRRVLENFMPEHFQQRLRDLMAC